MSQPAIILFNIATRSRPERFKQALNAILDNLDNKDDYRLVITIDDDDVTMNTTEMLEYLTGLKNAMIFGGSSVSKIHAINRSIPALDLFAWDILCNVSDDQQFLVKGFDNVIRQKMQQYYPDLDGVLHFPDTVTGDKLITLSIMGEKYFRRFGFIYDPSFFSVYADNQFGDIAKILNKYTFIDQSIYIHLHPAFGLAQTDEQYQRTEHPLLYQKDRETYLTNKQNNFGL